MKIQVLSDLHIEVHQNLVVGPEDFVGDVIVLAGDICNHFNRSFAEILPKNVPIIYVLGNHEYYGGNWDTKKNNLLSEIDSTGHKKVHLLENDSVVIDGVRFLGTTLWTELKSREGEFQGYDCKRGINDFWTIDNFGTGKWLDANLAAVQWLDGCFQTKHSGKTVVVTHHAPSFKSDGPQFERSKISGGWCTSLDQNISVWEPELWIHGHVHHPVDYRIGKTRVVANPHGYFKENSGWSPRFTVEI